MTQITSLENVSFHSPVEYNIHNRSGVWIDPFLDYILRIPPIFYNLPVGIVLGIGSLASTILIYYLFKSGKFRSHTFCIITSLAIADLLTCLSGAFVVFWLNPTMPLSLPLLLCGLTAYVLYTAMTNSLYHLILFAGMRFYQLVYPLKAKAHITVGIVSKSCILIWTISSLANVPNIWEHAAIDINHGTRRIRICTFVGDYRVRNIIFHVLIFGIPCVFIMSLHLVKFFKVRDTVKTTEIMSSQDDRKGTVQRAMTIMIVTFFVCWFPSLFHDMSHDVFHVPYALTHLFAYSITDSILIFNSVANPFIYMLIAKPIREDILRNIMPSCACKR